MDSFELNKIAAAVLGALLLVLGSGFLAELLIKPRTAPKDKPGYALPVPEVVAAGGAAPAAEQVEPIAVRLASADAGKGAGAAKKCTACHNFEKGAPNKVGPALYGVVENTKGAHAGFGYSAALKERGAKGEKWGFEELDGFLLNPKGYIKGTSMAFAGVANAKERADIVAYLRSLADTPVPLPASPSN